MASFPNDVAEIILECLPVRGPAAWVPPGMYPSCNYTTFACHLNDEAFQAANYNETASVIKFRLPPLPPAQHPSSWRPSDEDPDKIDWRMASMHSPDEAWLRRHFKRICWGWLSANPNAGNLLAENPDKIERRSLHGNRGTVMRTDFGALRLLLTGIGPAADPAAIYATAPLRYIVCGLAGPAMDRSVRRLAPAGTTIARSEHELTKKSWIYVAENKNRVPLGVRRVATVQFKQDGCTKGRFKAKAN